MGAAVRGFKSGEMEQIMSELVKILIATIVSGMVLYIGIINKLRSQNSVNENRLKQLEENCKEAQTRFGDVTNHYAVIEEKVKRIENRQDSHSKKYDELMSTISDLKLEIVKQFSGLKNEINAFNSMVEMADHGVKINKKEK